MLQVRLIRRTATTGQYALNDVVINKGAGPTAQCLRANNDIITTYKADGPIFLYRPAPPPTTSRGGARASRPDRHLVTPIALHARGRPIIL
jgi:hypothetical protein